MAPAKAARAKPIIPLPGPTRLETSSLGKSSARNPAINAAGTTIGRTLIAWVFEIWRASLKLTQGFKAVASAAAKTSKIMIIREADINAPPRMEGTGVQLIPPELAVAARVTNEGPQFQNPRKEVPKQATY